MRCKVLFVVLSAALLSVLACGGGNGYSDAVKVNTEFVNAMERYIDDIDNAGSASAVVAAIDTYAGEIEKLAPEMKAIADRHPEWKDDSKVPEELKPLQEKVRKIAAKIPASFAKSMKYMMDTEVQQAQQRLQEAMAKMQ